MKYLVYVFLLIVLVFSCRKDRVGYKATPYFLDIPSHFPDMIIPTDNPMTVEGVDLGRYLFYEKKLSGDNSMSCASCHMPENSFSDPNQYSTGIDGIQGTRQSMALVNMGWENFFFWDGRETTLEKQILDPVINPIEMHETWKNAVAKLNQDMNYRNRFFRAFGEGGIDSVKAAKAIAQFIRTMISGQSKYDVMYKYENGMSLSATEQSIFQTIDPEEWAGYDLFKSLNGADCFHCHNGPLMRVKKFSNNGLLPNFLNDLGRAAVTNNPEDNYKFKVPTLRNIALTAPYMHDGRFKKLSEVMNHYVSGVQQGPTLSKILQKKQ
jgi:cytochrome c peroxidase